MIIRPTNSGIYTLKDPAMYAIRNVDARQAAIAKSSYVNLKLAEEMMQILKVTYLKSYDGFSDHYLHTITFNSLGMQQLD